MGVECYDDSFGAWQFVHFSSTWRHSTGCHSHQGTKLLAVNGEASSSDFTPRRTGWGIFILCGEAHRITSW
jgi:hypothetical protein